MPHLRTHTTQKCVSVTTGKNQIWSTMWTPWIFEFWWNLWMLSQHWILETKVNWICRVGTLSLDGHWMDRRKGGTKEWRTDGQKEEWKGGRKKRRNRWRGEGMKEGSNDWRKEGRKEENMDRRKERRDAERTKEGKKGVSVLYMCMWYVFLCCLRRSWAGFIIYQHSKPSCRDQSHWGVPASWKLKMLKLLFTSVSGFNVVAVGEFLKECECFTADLFQFQPQWNTLRSFSFLVRPRCSADRGPQRTSRGMGADHWHCWWRTHAGRPVRSRVDSPDNCRCHSNLPTQDGNLIWSFWFVPTQQRFPVWGLGSPN